jgi:phosphoglycolate phosphatase
MKAQIRLAVFDVDGTLVDSQHNILAAMTAAWRRHGLGDPEPAAVRRIIGLSLVEAVATLLPTHEASLHETIAQSYKDAFFTLRHQPDHQEPLFPGALDALASLDQAGWLLGVATGKTRRGLDAMIERHGLQNRFVTIQTADGNPGKPHPGMLLRALAEAGAEPADAVMIGDTVYDITMGRAARVATLGVTWGYHPPEELTAAGADRLVEDYADLPAALTVLLGEGRCVSR